MNPLGNAIANETIAASSPSLASAVLIFKTLDKFLRWLMARSSMSAESPVAFSQGCIIFFCGKFTIFLERKSFQIELEINYLYLGVEFLD